MLPMKEHLIIIHLLYQVVTDYLTMVMNMVGWVIQLRKYVFKPAINSSSESSLAGVYAGLYANGKYFVEQEWRYYSMISQPSTNYDVKQVEGGVLMGIQLIFSEKISLDLFAGGGLRNSEFDHKPS